MSLAPAPSAIADASGTPHFGTYAGESPRIALGSLSGRWALPPVQRFFKRKRWHFTFVATREVAVLAAVADLNYIANAFVAAIELATGRVLADEGFLNLPGPHVCVNDTPGEGLEARFRLPGARFASWRAAGDTSYRTHVSVSRMLRPLSGALRWSGALETWDAPPPITLIAPIEADGRLNITQKWTGLVSSGLLEVGGRRFSLDGGVGGVDYTQGLLARQTSWRWAFSAGRLADGTPFGFNLVEGFNEANDATNENALWLGKTLVPLGQARFDFDSAKPRSPWRMETKDGALEATFEPMHAHVERKNLLLVKSDFVQPVGLFKGRLRLPDGRMLRFERLPGVTELQRMEW